MVTGRSAPADELTGGVIGVTRTPPAPVSTATLWIGRIVSAVPALMLTGSGVVKLVKPDPLVEEFTRLGYPASLALGIGILELFCTALYVLPRTAVLGAILLTGYLGGATATHVRIGDPFFAPVVLGVLLWGGLYLRDPRLRALAPLRRDPASDFAAGRGITSLLKKTLFGFVAVVVVLVIFVALQPAAFRVVRSATIAAPPPEVFAQVNDFHHWEAWSPWAKLDPAAKNTFEGPSAGTGAVFTWSGNDQIGEGRMTLVESRRDELIRIKLDFVRPFESTCDVEFAFKAEGNQTVVTWGMSGENNFVGKAFCLFMNMDKTLGGEFEKGLAQMKAVAEAAAKK
jgi:uncharacterized protein YndB with AHSA1/START domain